MGQPELLKPDGVPCDECGGEHLFVARFPRFLIPVDICELCLRKALSLIDEEKNKVVE